MIIFNEGHKIKLGNIMHFQKASNADFQGILDLQQKNLAHNLTDLEKKDGFLSVEFTKEQFGVMNTQTGIVICKDKEDILGYLCTSSLEFNKSFELPAAMMELYEQLPYKGKLLEHYHSIVVGPWCIERNSRGKNIFLGMWNMLSEILTEDIELLTTFISTNNSRSLYAAKKAGMEEVTTFEFHKNKFYLLAKMNSMNHL